MNQSVVDVVDIITSDDDKKYEPAGRMANAIIEITLKQGGCLPQDLNEKGFTPHEVADWWHMANALASVELRSATKPEAQRPSFVSSRR